MNTRDELRAIALTLATAETVVTKSHWNHGPRGDETTQILADADRFYTWLTATPPVARITLTAGPVTDQATTTPHSPHSAGDNTMALEVGDSQQFTLTAHPVDAAGQPATDTITWAVDNTTAVKPLEVSADTLSVTIKGLAPATAVTATATDVSGHSAPFVFDVLSGPVVSLGLTASPVTDQAPAAPAPPTA